MSSKGPSVTLAVCVLLIVAAYSLTRPLEDFIEYWASGHLIVSGQNPYSLDGMSRMESSLGWKQPVPLMNLSAPWALPLIAPLGLVRSYSAAWLLWVLLMSGLLAWSARILLDIYSQGRPIFPRESRWSESLIAFTFYPALLSLKFAQITTLSLLGLAGFLYFENRQKCALAGASLVLASFKPQLLALVWLALLLESLRSRKWKLLVGFGASLAVLSIPASLMRPSVWRDYAALSRSGYLTIWPSAIGSILRAPFGGSARSFALQFLPLAIGVVWCACYYLRHRDSWIWSERLPMVVTVSLLTAAYGWLFDEVLLVIPIIALTWRLTSTAGSIPARFVWLYTAVNVATILAAAFDSPAGFLAAPIFLLYIFARTADSEAARLATAMR